MPRLLTLLSIGLAAALVVVLLLERAPRDAADAPRFASEPGEPAVLPVELGEPASPSLADRNAVFASVDPRGGEPDDELAERGGRALRLRIVEARSRRAASGLDVTLTQGSFEATLRTGPDGVVETDAVWAPGTISVRHRPDPARSAVSSRWELEPNELSIGVEPTVLEATIVARRPAFTLLVETRAPDGRAVPGAEVTLVHGWRGTGGRFLSEWVASERANDEGRACFPIFDRDATGTSLLLHARHADAGLASDVVPLDAPLHPGPWVLGLQPMGSVRVLAEDRAGLPLARGTALATTAAAARAASIRASARVVDGVGVVEGLAAGAYRLRVFAGASDDVREVEVVVEAGRESEVRVHFDDGASGVAVAGRVVDEDGVGLAGVSIWCEAAGQGWRIRRSAEDGRFAFELPRTSSSIRLSTESDVTNDAFEPGTLDVAFGTTDVTLRRVARSTPRRLELDVRDAVTGAAPEEGGGVYLVLGEPRTFGGWGWESLENGRVAVVVDWRPGLRYRVVCPGYLPVESDVPGDDDEPIRVDLRRGFARTLTVVDALTGAPVEGARVYDAEVGLDVETDRNGTARLASGRWPNRLRVEHPDYHADAVHLDDLESVTDRVVLEPIDRRH